jgi:hypothetical protein
VAGAFPNGTVALLIIAAMALLASGDPAGPNKKIKACNLLMTI